MAQKPTAQPDPLEGQELSILNSLLAVEHPKAKAGDADAVDRVLKIIDLKRKLRLDAATHAAEWEGS